MSAPKRLLMAEEWDQFARRVMPRGCLPIQRLEMRRAFYAGAESILVRIMTALSPDTEPTAEDLRMMEDLHNELRDFAMAIKAGRA